MNKLIANFNRFVESKLRCYPRYWIKFFRLTTYVDDSCRSRRNEVACTRFRGVLLENVLHEKCMKRARLPYEGRQLVSPVPLSSRE